MRAGKLDRRIDIQRSTPTTSDSGEQVEVWADIATNIPASVRPLSGDERFTSPQIVATDQVEFIIRYAIAVSTLTPLDRIVYPSRVSNSPALSTTMYDVLQVSELGRREGLRIAASRRPDEIS